MKKLLAATLCMILILGTLFIPASLADGKVTLTFMTTEAADAKSLAYYEDLIARFTQQNPNIEIELIQGGSWSDVDTKLNAASLSNTYPDMLLITLIALGARASLGEWTDLTPYIEQWNGKDDVYQAAQDIGIYQGKRYAVGVYPVPEIVAYRKDAFQEAGLDPAVPPKTWDDLLAYAQKLVQYDSQGNVVRSGFDVPMSDTNLTMFEAFLRQAGGDVIDSATGALTLDSPATVETLNYLKQFIDQKLTPAYNRGSGDPMSMNASAMGVVYTSTINNQIKEDPALKEKLGFFPYVTNKEAGSFSGYRIFAISESSPHKEEAFKFFTFLMDSSNMWERYKEFNHMPVRTSLEEAFVAEYPEMNKAMVECVKVGKGRPALSWVASLTNSELQMYEEVMYGQKTAEQALADCLSRIQEERAALGK